MRNPSERERERIARWLDRREREGLSWAQLSRFSGLAVWRLRYWQRKLRPDRIRSRGRTARAFLPVAITESTAGIAAPTIELTTPGGYQLRFPAGLAGDDLRRILAALPPRC
jgi:hypothetical protein